MILFSIITVSKNNARGLKSTARSLRIQRDAPAFEWIVIDGASTDGTMETLQQFESLNPQIVSEPDSGLYNAMNKGLARARGEYVWFLNAGDCLSDLDVLHDVQKILVNASLPDFFYGVAREDGRILTPRAFHAFRHGMITSHQAMLYRRNLVNDRRFDTHYKIAADYAFTLQFLDKAKKIDSTDRILVDTEARGLSNTYADTGREETYAIRRDLLGQNIFINALYRMISAASFALKRRYPSLYWQWRALVLPPARNTPPSPVHSEIRLFRRKIPFWIRMSQRK